MLDNGVGAGTACLYILLQHSTVHEQADVQDNVRVHFRVPSEKDGHPVWKPCAPETRPRKCCSGTVLQAKKDRHTEDKAQQRRERRAGDPAAESGSLTKELLFGGVRLPIPMEGVYEGIMRGRT